MRFHHLFVCLLLLAPLLSAQATLREGEVPAALAPWQDWVLHNETTIDCPFIYNRQEQRNCAWPGELQLKLHKAGGSFTQRWQIYAETVVALPGDNRIWPQHLLDNDRPVAIEERAGQPTLRLQPGEHRVSGEFIWPQLPDTLPLASDTGLISLTLNGQAQPFPHLDAKGRLWLGKRMKQDQPTDDERIELRVFRRLIDNIPFQITTHIEFKVSGRPREVLIGPVIDADSLPMSLQSPLPARLEPDHQLRIQLRPGLWTLTLTSRQQQAVTSLNFQSIPAPWPSEEIWVFDARSQLRLVEPQGVPAIDPQQTEMPNEWRQLPSFRVSPGDTLQLVEKRRGDPEPAPDRLNLQRELWLDFSGKGYTVQDTISGSVSRSWRLELPAPASLGRASINGEEQFITHLTDENRRGVEVRQGQIHLLADSRLEGPVSTLPATGWDQDFESLNITLHLPPGWRLFSASGADSISQTWLQQWTLLDIFLVLIIALATSRLWGRGWGVLALLTLTLIYQEANAPRWVWLFILAMSALQQVLPVGRFRHACTLLRTLGLLSLVLIAVPFMVDQVRQGLFPILEQPWQQLGAGVAQPFTTAPAEKPQPQVSGMMREESKRLKSVPEGIGKVLGYSDRLAPAGEPLDQYASDTKVQTGPGVPQWQWRRVNLGWNGPVERTQLLELNLLSPATNTTLAFLRTILILLLAIGMAGFRYRRDKGLQVPGWKLLFVALVLLPLLGTLPRQTLAAENTGFPSPALLQELKQRLLEPPPCLPQCASSPRLRLDIQQGTLTLRQAFHTSEAVAVPLPAQAAQWLPTTVLVDGHSGQGLSRDRQGVLWLELPAGVHDVQLQGPLPEGESLQLPLALSPHRVEANTSGWNVNGIRADGSAEAQLELRRERKPVAGEEQPALKPGILPALLRVERDIQLGLSWTVTTRVVRLTPTGAGVVASIPLLPGESLTSADIEVQDGQVQVNMEAGQRELHWQSQLAIQPELQLQASESHDWVETWRLHSASMWHVAFTGIPVIHHQSLQGRWSPQWQPWPEEQVTLNISRPAGVEGSTLTLDSSKLQVDPGSTSTRFALEMALRSSLGGQHTITLPKHSELQSVVINGLSQPLRLLDNQLTLPLVPGAQTIALQWKQAHGIGWRYRLPPIDIGLQGANHSIELSIPQNRWVLFSGGQGMGPAILFWGVLFIVVLAALGLARTTLTPLKTHHWLLLGIGLSQVDIAIALLVVVWLFALAGRCRLPKVDRQLFNALQVLLAVLTYLALMALFFAIQQGLLGYPDMQVTGNGSHNFLLRWYQDRIDGSLASAWVITLPMWLYRILMLLWALWVAAAVLGWLKWGWGCFSQGGLWRRPTPTQETDEPDDATQLKWDGEELRSD